MLESIRVARRSAGSVVPAVPGPHAAELGAIRLRHEGQDNVFRNLFHSESTIRNPQSDIHTLASMRLR